MTTSQNTAKFEASMSAMDAIFHRRAVRDYAPQKIDQAIIRMLLDAAVHAPTAVHEEPWAFAIVQDRNTLKRLSDNVKELLASGADSIHPLLGRHGSDRFTTPEFNVFYNAGTLVVIYGKPLGSFVVADCWLAAENLMLGALPCFLSRQTERYGIHAAEIFEEQRFTFHHGKTCMWPDISQTQDSRSIGDDGNQIRLVSEFVDSGRISLNCPARRCDAGRVPIGKITGIRDRAL